MKAILACEKEGGIGFEGSMPWPKQEKDLARFKDLTLNTTVLMGRGTWQSTGMPKPLPNRTNIVLSTKDLNLPENVIQIRSIDEIGSMNVDWVIGGANLINSVWNLISEFHLSHLRKSYHCDTFLNLEQLYSDFTLENKQIYLTHNYEIWKKQHDR